MGYISGRKCLPAGQELLFLIHGHTHSMNREHVSVPVPVSHARERVRESQCGGSRGSNSEQTPKTQGPLRQLPSRHPGPESLSAPGSVGVWPWECALDRIQMSMDSPGIRTQCSIRSYSDHSFTLMRRSKSRSRKSVRRRKPSLKWSSNITSSRKSPLPTLLRLLPCPGTEQAVDAGPVSKGSWCPVIPSLLLCVHIVVHCPTHQAVHCAFAPRGPTVTAAVPSQDVGQPWDSSQLPRRL